MHTEPSVNEPPPIDPALLPTVGQLRKAVVGAVVLVLVLAVTVVLPAEEGIDPTGVGAMLGLTQMGQIGDAAPPPAPEPPAEPVHEFRTDEIEVTLGPGKGTEVKAVMRKGDQLVYSWETDGPRVFYDFHGEEAGAPADEFTSHEEGTKSAADGAFEAPFAGVHGWYWHNKTARPVRVRLKTSGVYASIGQPR